MSAIDSANSTASTENIHQWHELSRLPESLMSGFDFMITYGRYYSINPLNPDELMIAAFPQYADTEISKFGPLCNWFEVYDTKTNEYKDFDERNIHFSPKCYKFVNHYNPQQLVSIDFDSYTISILNHDSLKWQKYKLHLQSFDKSIASSFTPDKESKLNFCIDDEYGLLFIKYGAWKSYLLIVQLFDFQSIDIKNQANMKDNNRKQENKQNTAPIEKETKLTDKSDTDDTIKTKTGNYKSSIIANEIIPDDDWKCCRLLGMVYHNDNEIKEKREKKRKRGKKYQFLLALDGDFESWIDNLFIIDVTIDRIKNVESNKNKNTNKNKNNNVNINKNDKSRNNKKYNYTVKMCKNEKLTKILSTSAKQALHCGEDGVYVDDGLYFEFSNYSYSIYKKYYMIFVGGSWSHKSGWSSCNSDTIYYIDLVNCTFHASKVRWCLDCGFENCCSLLDCNQRYLHIFGGYGFPQCSREPLDSHFKIDIKYVIDELLHNDVVIPWLNQAQKSLNLYIPNDVIRLIEKYVTV